jgi:ABC-type transport system involved in Fe-S cluster assembly fused permease/ATPase subunit
VTVRQELSVTETAARVGGVLTVAIVLAFAFSLLSAVPVMVALGVAHHYFTRVPPLGYLETVVVVWTYRLLVHVGVINKKSSDQ